MLCIPPLTRPRGTRNLLSMAWIVRPLAALTVLLGMVATAYFTHTHQTERVPASARLQTLASLRQLPSTWPVSAVDYLESQRLPISRDELREVVRAIEKASLRHGADPLMVLAVIQVESRFDPWAVSPQGALGLMQVRPATAREIAPRLGIRWTSDDLLFDPDVNVAIGTYYLTHLLERFDGDLDAALAAYERGPGRVERLARSADVPLNYANRVWEAILALQSRVVA